MTALNGLVRNYRIYGVRRQGSMDVGIINTATEQGILKLGKAQMTGGGPASYVCSVTAGSALFCVLRF